MKMQQAAAIFEALSFETRLAIFRLLAEKSSDGMVAGEIARRLDIPASNLSFHLNAIARAGLVSVERQGRHQRYRANVAPAQEAAACLSSCCRRNPSPRWRDEEMVD